MNDLTTEIISQHFGIARGELCIAGLSVSAIMAQHDTPVFIYDGNILDRKWVLLRNTFPNEFAVSYSVKANPNPHILQLFLAKGCGLEIASAGELYLAVKAGCAPNKLLFAGPGKSVAELELALSSGVGEIHLESLLEAQRVNQISRRMQIKATVGLRVNPNCVAQGGAMRMGGKPAPFGVDAEQLHDTVAQVAKFPYLNFRGLHFYLGTQILDHNVLVRQYRHALKIVKQVATGLNRPLETVDFGGGLGIPYFTGERPLDMEALCGELHVLTAGVAADPAFDGTRFVVEPGRYLIGESGVYVTRVNDIKASRGKKFVIVDGGMNHHLAASGNLGQVIKKNFPMAVVNKLNLENQEKVDIVGPLCTPLDTLGRDVELPKIEVGDLLGVFQSGAYARTASPLYFLSYPSPAEVLVQDERTYLIRRRGTVEDMLQDIPSRSSLS